MVMNMSLEIKLTYKFKHERDNFPHKYHNSFCHAGLVIVYITGIRASRCSSVITISVMHCICYYYRLP